MPTVKVEAELTADTLLEAAEQLTPSELERLVDQLLMLRARKVAPVLSHEESTLLLTINEGLPSTEQKRLEKLLVKQRKETLTEDEHRELTQLINKKESLNVKRVEALIELARLRQKSLGELMQSLGIKPPPVK